MAKIVMSSACDRIVVVPGGKFGAHGIRIGAVSAKLRMRDRKRPRHLIHLSGIRQFLLLLLSSVSAFCDNIEVLALVEQPVCWLFLAAIVNPCPNPFNATMILLQSGECR